MLAPAASISLDELAAMIRAQPGFDPKRFDPDAYIASLPNDLVKAMADPILAADDKAKFSKFWDIFPDDGPFRRELYPRHMEHFAAGLEYMERCFMAANRVGKTVAGAWEVACHATGIYRDWW